MYEEVGVTIIAFVFRILKEKEKEKSSRAIFFFPSFFIIFWMEDHFHFHWKSWKVLYLSLMLFKS